MNVLVEFTEKVASWIVHGHGKVHRWTLCLSEAHLLRILPHHLGEMTSARLIGLPVLVVVFLAFVVPGLGHILAFNDERERRLKNGGKGERQTSDGPRLATKILAHVLIVIFRFAMYKCFRRCEMIRYREHRERSLEEGIGLHSPTPLLS